MQKSEKNFIFSKNLKYLRDMAGLNQVELAEKLGVSRGTIGNYETGMEPQRKLLKEIAVFFDVSIDQLLNTSLTLVDELHNKVSEEEHIYGGRISIPIVGKISNDKYDPQDVIGQVMFDRNEINPSFFFLYMFEEKLVTKGNKIIWKGDLLLINPNIKDIYPGDLVAVLSRSGRQWVRYVENWDRITLQLQGGIKLNSDEIAGMYRIVKVRPAEFEV